LRKCNKINPTNEIEVCFQYNDGYSEVIHAYANNINTEEGGTHLVGFKNALTKVVNEYGVKNKILKETENDEAAQQYVITSESANKWGILQYTKKIENMINLKETAQNLLSLYDKRTRTLSIDNVFGDIRVRAGVSLPIHLNIGDMILNNYMIVESAKHTFKNEEHFMDLSLRGGEFIG